MTDSTNKPNALFWVIGIVALLWNAMGVNAYLQQAYDTDAHRAQYSVEQLQIMENLPVWYTALFAIAVFAGALGCIFMLLRKNIANLLFKLSLIAVLAQTIYNLFINEGKEFYGAFEYSMLISIPIVAIFLVMYSKKSTEKGWIS
jgi:peptidoglycan/LPS O-acetylase OafA/YrhL